MQNEKQSTSIVSTLYDDADLVELVEMFVSQLPERLASMQDAFERSNISELRQYAHQLKGSGGSHGFPILTDKAAELENHCKAEMIEGIRVSLAELAQLIPCLKVRPE